MILLLQEHWLFTHELHILKKLQKHFDAHSKAVDKNCLIMPTQKPRGYGGTSIIYSTQIKVRKLEEGSERVTCVELPEAEPPLIICTVYMPAKGSKKRDDEFRMVLTELQVILETYAKTHGVIMGGDWNASFLHPDDARDKVLVSFIQQQSLRLSKNHPDTPTYSTVDGAESSCIDYIFSTEKVSTVNTWVRESASNTSDHKPVSTEVLVNYKKLPITPSTTSKSKSWKKTDVQMYNALVEEGVTRAGISTILTEFELDLAISKLTSILTAAKDIATPKRRQAQGTVKIFTPAVMDALKVKKEAHWKWKMDGEPRNLDSLTFQAMKDTRRKLRNVQRVVYAEKDTQEIEEIAEAHKTNSHEFHLLVKRRSQSVKVKQLEYLIVEGEKFEAPGDVCEAWKTHFSKLATPDEDSPDSAYYRDVIDIELVCSHQTTPRSQLVSGDVMALIKALNRNKAADIHGLTAEHLLYAGPAALQAITHIMGHIIQSSKLPSSQKVGSLTPVYKKAETHNPFNHRGITVTPVIEKLTETHNLQQSVPVLAPSQNHLQRGFSIDTPPLLAGLLIQEFIRTTPGPIYLCMLDVKTAFDTVWHEALLRQLYLDGIDGPLWMSYRNLYEDAVSKVSWCGHLSDSFPILQGVRQGAVCSAELYKRFNNPLLNLLVSSGVGAKIGHLAVPAPTCADDIALMATDPVELQTLINVVHDFSQTMKYELQPKKTNILVIRPDDTPCEFYLDGHLIERKQAVEHLGITRDKNGDSSLQIQINIEKSRKAAFRLFGAGFHGKNGLPQSVCIRLLTRDIIPILTYGLHIFQLDADSIKPIEVAFRRLTKQILSIADNTGDAILPVLTGVLPAQAVVEMNALAMFGSICRNQNCMENELANRQLSLRTDKSWYQYVKEITSKLDLPLPEELLSNPPSKSSWKTMYKNATCTYWREKTLRLFATYPSARFLNPLAMKFGSPHPVIRYAPGTKVHVKRCATSLQVLTGSYMLQTNRSNFNQHGTKPTCLICRSGPENRIHLISCCPATEHIRCRFRKKLKDILSEHFPAPEHLQQLLFDPPTFTALVLDCTAPAITHSIPIPVTAVRDVIAVCQQLTHCISEERLILLQRIAPSIQKKRKNRPRKSRKPCGPIHA